LEVIMDWVQVRNKVLFSYCLEIFKMALAIPYRIILARFYSLSLSLSLCGKLFGVERCS